MLISSKAKFLNISVILTYFPHRIYFRPFSSVSSSWFQVNSHPTDWDKCVEIVKTLHVKFFPFGSPASYGRVTVNVVVSKLILAFSSLYWCFI